MTDSVVLSSLRKKSLIGLFLFSIFCVTFIVNYFEYKNPYVGILSIIGSSVSWYIFSHYHTKIAICRIQAIADEYVSIIKASKK